MRIKFFLIFFLAVNSSNLTSQGIQQSRFPQKSPINLEEAMDQIELFLPDTLNHYIKSNARDVVVLTLNEGPLAEKIVKAWNLGYDSELNSFFQDSLNIWDYRYMTFILFTLLHEVKLNLNVKTTKEIITDFIEYPSKYGFYGIVNSHHKYQIGDTLGIVEDYYEFPATDVGVSTTYTVICLVKETKPEWEKVRVQVLYIDSERKHPKISHKYIVGNEFWMGTTWNFDPLRYGIVF